MNETFCPECSWPRCLSTDACGVCGRHFLELPPADTDPENKQIRPLPTPGDNFWQRNGIHLGIIFLFLMGWLFLSPNLFGLQHAATAAYLLVVAGMKRRQYKNKIVTYRIPLEDECTYMLVAGVLMLLNWLSTGPTPSTAQFASQKISPAPSPSIHIPREYRILARHLHSEPHDAPEKFVAPDTTTAIYAEIHSAILELEGIQTSDQQLRYITDQALAAFREMQQRVEKLDSLPKPPSEDKLLAESFILGAYSGFTGDPSGVALGLNSVADAEQKQAALLHAINELDATFHKLLAIQSLLPKIAQQYAAQPVASGHRIGVDMAATWGGAIDHDWLCLYNSGAAITDCTIQVTLVGASGETKSLVHFVPHWPSQTRQYVRYLPGVAVGERVLFRTTVADIESVGLQIWSPSFTTQMTYTYQGEPRDRDIAKYCQDLKLKADYQRFQAGVLWDTQRSASIRMDGLTWIPGGRLTVAFRKGEASRTYYQDFANWESGNSLTIRPQVEDMQFEADQLDVWLSFPKTAYQHRASFTINR